MVHICVYILNHFYFYINTCRQIQSGKRFYDFLARIKDIYQPFVHPEFKLFPGILMHESGAVDRVFLDFSRKRDGTDGFRVHPFDRFNYLFARIINQLVIVRLYSQP